MIGDHRHRPPVLPLLVAFLLLSTTVSHALAQWKNNQRTHELSWLRDDEMRALAKLTDVQSIWSLLRPILVERQVGTPQHDAVAHYLKTKVEEFGFTAEWDSFMAHTPMGVKRFHNLVATFDPLIHRRLVLACHYDSKIIPGKVFIGATDSALPCALLLDIAKTLGPLLASRTNQRQQFQFRHPQQWPIGPPASPNWPNIGHRRRRRRATVFVPPPPPPPSSGGGAILAQLPQSRATVVPNSWPIPPPPQPANTRRGGGEKVDSHITLQLIFLDGEEAFHEWSHLDSIYGARHLADTWERKWYPSTDGSAFELSREIDRIDVFVLLDLLGAKNPHIQSVPGHGAASLFEQLPYTEGQLAKLNLLNRIPRIFYPGTSYFGAVEDDHLAFMRKGVPVLHLISVPFPHFWHTPGDNANILDNPTIENLATIMRVFVARYLGIHPTV
ncbi:hypothetical protein niasHT_031598 [Heterodera trifolii]|uniref:glutaminyl-peptide cyclotransferase n=1 Tax=Heterodera trifolii TaxID=157864 RepID=A0ABD2J5P5_9BILA